MDMLCLNPLPLQFGVVFILTCCCGSVPPISPIVVFVAVLFLLSIEPTTPVLLRVASQWSERPSSSNGDHNSSEMAGALPVGRRARSIRTTPSDYVRTTPRSTLLVSDFGRMNSPPAGPRHMDHSAAELPKPHPSDMFAPRSASMLHSAGLALHYLHICASCQHKPQDRPSTSTSSWASELRHMHDAPRTSILE